MMSGDRRARIEAWREQLTTEGIVSFAARQTGSVTIIAAGGLVVLLSVAMVFLMFPAPWSWIVSALVIAVFAWPVIRMISAATTQRAPLNVRTEGIQIPGYGDFPWEVIKGVRMVPDGTGYLLVLRLDRDWLADQPDPPKAGNIDHDDLHRDEIVTWYPLVDDPESFLAFVQNEVATRNGLRSD